MRTVLPISAVTADPSESSTTRPKLQAAPRLAGHSNELKAREFRQPWGACRTTPAADATFQDASQNFHSPLQSTETKYLRLHHHRPSTFQRCVTRAGFTASEFGRTLSPSGGDGSD